MSVWLWVRDVTGTHIPSSGSQWYNFWSGFGSDLAEFAILGGLVHVVRNYNCHEKGCWRLSRHVTAKGYKLCQKHVSIPEDQLHLHPIHPDHLAGR